MRYVKHFDINGVDVRQVACIELHGAPNAATEGAVGVLGIDVDSAAHKMYKCVAVKGSIYTWEACEGNGSGGSGDIQTLDEMLQGFEREPGSVKKYVDSVAGSSGGDSGLTEEDEERVREIAGEFMTDVEANRRVTSVDLSRLDTEGKIVETYAGGSSETFSMEFDAAGNPVKITDQSGNETVLVW